MLDLPGTLALRGARECVALWAAVSNVSIARDQSDAFSWPWSSSGKYTASSTYKMLMQGNKLFALATAIWESKATPKAKQFMWLAAQHRIWTADRRVRHGLQTIKSPCFVCLQEEDTAEHILIQCVFAREVWFTCRQLLGAQFELPSVSSLLEPWWIAERARAAEVDRRWFDGLVCSVGHALWKNRNAWCFNNVERQMTARRLATTVVEQLRQLKQLHDQGVGVLDTG
jgi:hypothetical protein